MQLQNENSQQVSNPVLTKKQDSRIVISFSFYRYHGLVAKKVIGELPPGPQNVLLLTMIVLHFIVHVHRCALWFTRFARFAVVVCCGGLLLRFCVTVCCCGMLLRFAFVVYCCGLLLWLAVGGGCVHVRYESLI